MDVKWFFFMNKVCCLLYNPGIHLEHKNQMKAQNVSMVLRDLDCVNADCLSMRLQDSKLLV